MRTAIRFMSMDAVFITTMMTVPALAVICAFLARKRVRFWIPLAAGAGIMVFYMAALARSHVHWMRNLGEMVTGITLIVMVLVTPLALLGIYFVVGRTSPRWRKPLGMGRAVIAALGYLTAILGVAWVGNLPEEGNYAPIVECRSHLNEIGIACKVYAWDHDGKYPPTLGVLLKDYLTGPKIFICRSSDQEAPSDFPKDMKTADLKDLDRVEEFGSYVLAKGIDGRDDSDLLMLYEKDGAHGGEGRNVVFADGHVKWLSEAEFLKQLKRQHEILVKGKEDVR